MNIPIRCRNNVKKHWTWISEVKVLYICNDNDAGRIDDRVGMKNIAMWVSERLANWLAVRFHFISTLATTSMTKEKSQIKKWFIHCASSQLDSIDPSCWSCQLLKGSWLGLHKLNNDQQTRTLDAVKVKTEKSFLEKAPKSRHLLAVYYFGRLRSIILEDEDNMEQLKFFFFLFELMTTKLRLFFSIRAERELSSGRDNGKIFPKEVNEFFCWLMSRVQNSKKKTKSLVIFTLDIVGQTAVK